MANKMTGHEKIAARNIKGAFNQEFGGMYNTFQDGEEITLTLNQMKDIVYDCAMNDDYRVQGVVHYGRAPKEMRFAGSRILQELRRQAVCRRPRCERGSMGSRRGGH